MIRDGGSYSAGFMSEGGDELRLHFRVNQRSAPPSHIEKLGYHAPKIYRVAAIMHDGMRVGHTGTEVETISWEEAGSVLREIEPLLSPEDTWSRRYLQEMVAVAARSGRPEPGVPTLVRTIRLGEPNDR